MKNLFKILILPVFLALAFVACSDDDEAVPPYLKFVTENDSDATELVVSADSYTQTYYLKSNVEWTIETPDFPGNSSEAAWFTVNPRQGNGDASIKVSLLKNETSKPRSSSFVVSAKGLEEIKFNISQSAGDEVIQVQADKTEMAAAGDTVKFAVTANFEWNYTVSNMSVNHEAVDYKEVEKTADKLVLAFAANEAESEMSFQVLFSGDKASYTCDLKQLGKEPAGLVADLLDIEFQADGTAKDVSPMKHEVKTYAGPTLSTYKSDVLNRYVAKFNNPVYELVTSGFYAVEYKANDDFINNIADGCTFETIFKINVEHTGAREMKWFSSMNAGGIGFLLPTTANGASITFLPNVTTSGNSTWIWTPSGRKARVGQFYHVVGVYDKEKQTSSVYINGELYNTVVCAGNYRPVSTAGSEVFIIGGDAFNNKTSCESSINGEVAMARIYSKPLDAEQISALWKATEFEEDKSVIEINRTQFLPYAQIAAGYKYKIYGKGFAAGDKIKFESTNGSFEVDARVDSEKAVVTMPASVASQMYTMKVVRGDQSAVIGSVKFEVVENPHISAPKIIAHRGIHVTGETENSCGSLREAMKFNAYGSELDVHMTKDGKVVVHHDGYANGVYFQNVNYDAIKNIKLANGELLPTFEGMIEVLNEYKNTSSTKMIVEFKTGSEGIRAVDGVMKMVEEAGIKDRVEYISFGYDICQYIVSKDANAIVGFLAGGKDPATVNADGIKSIDYNSGVFTNNPTWIPDAQKLGMIVNVWTVNTESLMLDFIGRGVDYITTDQCELLKSLIDKKFVEK